MDWSHLLANFSLVLHILSCTVTRVEAVVFWGRQVSLGGVKFDSSTRRWWTAAWEAWEPARWFKKKTKTSEELCAEDTAEVGEEKINGYRFKNHRNSLCWIKVNYSLPVKAVESPLSFSLPFFFLPPVKLRPGVTATVSGLTKFFRNANSTFMEALLPLTRWVTPCDKQ